MFRKILRAVLPSALVLFVISCLDPYEPPATNGNKSFLVVDGFVNSGNNTAEVKLSRTVPLNDPSNGRPVFGSVQIESNNGKIFQLSPTQAGVYTGSSLDVVNGEKYRLRIFAEGGEYLSDEVELRRAPVLDSVTWKGAEDGVTVYVDSHDVEGSTEYYLWTFTEDWEYNSQLLSAYEFDPVNATVTQRRPGNYVYVCWNRSVSTRVLITATTQISQDIVSDFPLTFIKKGSPKVSRLYSIQVQQRALDEAAYNYWKNLQKSTENLGGLFDPLPSEVTGNVRNVANRSERVLGYFSGGEIQEKRIFISRDDLPLDLRVVDGIPCQLDSISIGNLALYKNYPLYLFNSYGVPATLGYLRADGECLDCRLSGGKLEKPEFWPR